MIMINCYIAVAFVKYFSYQNNKHTVSNEASSSTYLSKLKVHKGRSHTFRVRKGIPYTRTSTTLVASTFYLENKQQTVKYLTEQASHLLKYLTIYLIIFHSTNS